MEHLAYTGWSDILFILSILLINSGIFAMFANKAKREARKEIFIRKYNLIKDENYID
jgi:hypothetical protein